MSVQQCPECQAKAPITKTWTRSSDGAILRRRTCDRCNESWTTTERLLGSMAENAICATTLVEMFETLGIRVDLNR